MRGTVTEFQSIDDAFRAMLGRLLADGEPVDSRNGPTLELTAQIVTIAEPTDRFLRTPGRNNNPFATIAETMWVIAGRNDLDYLTPYVRRAPGYSDDGGATWRAGYGPRLRNWHGIDQVAQTHALLAASPSSRRAVMTLFDPAVDYQDSKDIPCNNWLHFLTRNGRLDLNVSARSTDIWFGFSAINLFEWSVLLEMMAHWLHLDVGRLTFFTSSLHLYDHQQQRARELLEPEVPAATTVLHRARYHTDWGQAAVAHAQWMDLEARLRGGTDLNDAEIPFTDPMLVAYIRAIDIFWAFKRGADVSDLEHRLAHLGNSDLAVAAREFVSRPRAADH